MKKSNSGRLTSLRMTRRPATSATLSPSESSTSSKSPNHGDKRCAIASLKHSLSTSREGVEVELKSQPLPQPPPPTTDDTVGSKVKMEKSRRWWKSETPSILPAITATETVADDDTSIVEDTMSGQVAVVAPRNSSPHRTQKPYHPASRKYRGSAMLEIAAFVSGLLSAALRRAQIDQGDLFEENVDFLLWGVVLGWASTIIFAVAITLAWRAAVAYRKVNTPVGAGGGVGVVAGAHAPATEGGLERGGSVPLMVTSWILSTLGIGTYVILSALFTSFQVRPLWIAVMTIVDAVAFLLMFLHAWAARRRKTIHCCDCCGR